MTTETLRLWQMSELQGTTVCLHRAVSRMTQLLRHRPMTPDSAWEHDYAAARKSFVDAHRSYLAGVDALAAPPAVMQAADREE